MAYESLGKYATKGIINAIDHVTEETDAGTILALVSNTVSLAKDRVISEAQLDLIDEAMPSEVDVPDWEPETTEDGLTLQDVADMAFELTEVIDGIINPEEE